MPVEGGARVAIIEARRPDERGRPVGAPQDARGAAGRRRRSSCAPTTRSRLLPTVRSRCARAPPRAGRRRATSRRSSPTTGWPIRRPRPGSAGSPAAGRASRSPTPARPTPSSIRAELTPLLLDLTDARPAARLAGGPRGGAARDRAVRRRSRRRLGRAGTAVAAAASAAPPRPAAAAPGRPTDADTGAEARRRRTTPTPPEELGAPRGPGGRAPSRASRSCSACGRTSRATSSLVGRGGAAVGPRHRSCSTSSPRIAAALDRRALRDAFLDRARAGGRAARGERLAGARPRRAGPRLAAPPGRGLSRMPGVTAPSSRRLDATVRGRVQGVGFRYFVLRDGMDLGLGGWVANEPDGVRPLRRRGPAGAPRAPARRGCGEGPPARGRAIGCSDALECRRPARSAPSAVRSGGHRGRLSRLTLRPVRRPGPVGYSAPGPRRRILDDDGAESAAEELPALYRAVLDRVAELEAGGRSRPRPARVRAEATAIYSRAWDDRARRSLEALLRARTPRRVLRGRAPPAAASAGRRASAPT